MILVVSGLPRSGTSLVMQMLRAGGVPAFSDGVRGADDSNPRGYLEHERVKSLARDNEWVTSAEGHALKVHAPLLRMSKADIAREGARRGVDFSRTVSCYQADDQGRACGRCDACRLRAEGFAAAGLADPTRYAPRA